MKTISITDFEKLVALKNWKREQEFVAIERTTRQDEEYDPESGYHNQVEIPHVYGWVTKTSTLDNIKIAYTESFNFDENDFDTLSTGTEGMDDVWSLDGAIVVDDEGDELDVYDLAAYLDSRFTEIDYTGLEIDKVIDIDVNEDSKMGTFTIEIDNKPNLRFTGELLASVSNSDNTGRWTELALYKTKGGKYVCHEIARTSWGTLQNERDSFKGKLCETLAEVKEFFGYSQLAKELYAEANIDYAIVIE